jgi:hypothetical protein
MVRRDLFARHSRESGNPATLLIQSVKKAKALDSRFRGNDKMEFPAPCRS